MTREARAQGRPAVVVQAEAGAAAVLTRSLSAGACGALRVHAPWIGSLGPRFGASRCWLAEQGAAGDVYTVSGGISWRPAVYRQTRLVVEAEVGLAVTAGAGHALVGGAFGLDVPIIDGLTIGPVLRYQQLLRGSASDDLRMASLSVVLGFSSELFSRPVARAATRRDTPVPIRATRPARASRTPPPVVAPTPTPTPAPPPVDLTVDGDHDGVPDATDACPADPPGSLPDAARPGCPLVDRDRDLVPDASDACPDLTGAPHLERPLHGCPGSLRVDGNRLRFDEPLVFDVVRLRRASFPALRELRSVLGALPPTVRVTLVGHATAEPDPVGRVQLAEDRARAVLAWLRAHDVDLANVVTSAAPPAGVPAPPDLSSSESVDFWLTGPRER